MFPSTYFEELEILEALEDAYEHGGLVADRNVDLLQSYGFVDDYSFGGRTTCKALNSLGREYYERKS